LVRAVDAIRLCREGGYEALDSGKAIWALERVLRGIVREARGFVSRARLTSFPLSAMDDSDIVKLLANQLKGRNLIALQEVEPSAASGKAATKTAKLRRLVREIESKTRGRLSFSGRTYRLVVDVSLAKLPGRDSYQVARQDEARQVLDGLAEQPGTPSNVRPLLGEAREALSKDWRPPLQPDGLVLLRKIITMQASAPDAGPALTPSQIKKLATHTDWIEIEVVDQDGLPYTGGYRLELPDSTASESNFDEEGFLGNYDLESGTCKLFLLDQKIPKGGAVQPSDADTVWISFEVVNEDGQCIEDRRFSLALSDSSTKEGTLAGSTIRFDNIPAGACNLTLFTEDATTAGTAASSAETGADSAETGADSAETGANSAETGADSAETMLSAALPANVVPIKLRFKLLDLAGKPISGASVTVAGTAVTSDGDGMVETEVTTAPQDLQAILPSGNVALNVGSLNPQDDSGDDGYKVRLFNMGFLWDANADPTDDEMIIAVQDFQAQYKVPVSGQLDGATKAKLVEVYGC